MATVLPTSPPLPPAHGLVDPGKHDTAVRYFDRALKLDLEAAESHYQMGRARLELGEHRQAIEDFHEAARLGSCYPFFGYDRDVSLSNRRRRISRATAWLRSDLHAMQRCRADRTSRP